MGSAHRVTVWFDGACRLCQREIAVLKRLDRRNAVRFIDIAPADAGALCPLDPEIMLGRFHAEADGQMLSGAAAFAAVWRQLPLLKPLGYLARNALVLRSLERLYLGFLHIRPQLQRMIPPRKPK